MTNFVIRSPKGVKGSAESNFYDESRGRKMQVVLQLSSTSVANLAISFVYY